MRWVRLAVLSICGVLQLALTGCGSNGPEGPTPPGAWDFPASSKFAVTLLSDQESYAVGDSFEVKVVFYNLQGVFGAAFAVTYPPAQMEAEEIVENPSFLVRGGSLGDDHVWVSAIDDHSPADPDTVSYGFSYLRDGNDEFNGSGVLVKIRCRAVAAGTSVLSFDSDKFDIRKADGNQIDGIDNLARESLEITIR